MAINKGYLESNKTDSGDEVYTPFYAVEPILKYLDKSKTYWLPFDEDWSAFNQMLKENGFKVVISSIEKGKDFFEYEPENWDVLISNPPFSKKDKVLERCYKLGKPFILLLPMNSLQGKTRYKYFKNGIPLITFDSRIDYHRPNSLAHCQKGTPFASAYFCKDVLPKDLIIEELKKYQRELK